MKMGKVILSFVVLSFAMSSFGVDGKLILSKYGYAEVRLEYDDYGNVKKELRFDANGKLIVPDGEGVQYD